MYIYNQFVFIGNHAFDTPSAPLDLKAALKGSRFVTLSWSPPKVSKEPINGYSIFYQQVGSNRERVVNSTKGNLEEINIQSLSPGTSYIFRVMARNRHGVGAASQPLKITTQAELDVPEPVAKLEAKATTSFSILVSWSQPKLAAANSVTKYKLYYRQVCTFQKFLFSHLVHCLPCKTNCFSRLLRPRKKQDLLLFTITSRE